MDRILGIKQLIAVAVMLLISSSVAAVGGIEMTAKYGHVMARGLVLTDDGYPIYAEYDESGAIVNEQVAIKDAALEGAYVISGDNYRAVVSYYRQFLSNNQNGIARGAYILSNEAYRSKAFVTLDGTPLDSGAKAPLLNNVKSVLVRNNQQLFIPQNDPSLVQAVLNLNNISATVENNNAIASVLLDNRGNVVHSSQNNIGLKVRYFEGQTDAGSAPERGKKIYDPLVGRPVSVPVAFAWGNTTTDQDGKFVAQYMMLPCPGFSYSIKSPVTVELNFAIFNPKGEVKPVTYSLSHPGYDTCAGYSAIPPSLTLNGLMSQVAAIGIEAAMSYPLLYQYAIKVDTAVVNGTGFLSNGLGKIPTADTKYSYQAPDLTPKAYSGFDFDGDGSLDKSVPGEIVNKANEDGVFVDVFEEQPNGTLQGIYLSSGSNDPASEDQDINQPDFVRLGDIVPDFNHQGLLESISESDFKDTDILIFRESNGLLVTKRQGLDGRDVNSVLNQGSVNAESSLMQFSMLLRGPASAPFDYLGYGNTYSQWQSAAGINPALHERKADHLRPHEKLKVVAINRKTGYIGTARTTYGTLTNGGEGAVSMFAVLKMLPPNLKIIAEREYDVQSGLTKGQERQYLIGYEGAALASDRIIKITTQWFDHDGSPLPEGLGDFGYTGRLAKIVGVNTLGKDGSALAEFSIKPGSHTQQLQVGNNATKNEHYYVQVNGQSINENPTFDTLGAGEGPLRYRPKNYVPVLTPILDESLTWQQYLAYRQYQSDNPTETIEKPDPLYRWFYRPELQFSLYSLAVKNIYSQSAEAGSQEIDIYQDDKPVIASSDDFLRILYDLLEQDIAPLDFLGAGQELVLALGEEEISATVGEGQQIIFNNLEHLSSLDVEDFLSLRLYSNNDSANVLWEYAFDYLAVYTPHDNELNENGGNYFFISADEPSLELEASLMSYLTGGNPEDSTAHFIWELESGGASLSSNASITDTGVARTIVTLPPVTGASAIVTAKIDTDTKAIFSEIVVIAGKPNTVTMNMSGAAYTRGVGELIAEISVKDKHGNAVLGGTGINFSIQGDAYISEASATVNESGIATVKIKGGDYVSSNNKLIAYVNDIETSAIFSIGGVNVDIIEAPDSIVAGGHETFVIKAYTPLGPSQGIPVDFSVTNGMIRSHSGLTNAEGEMTVSWHAPITPGDSTFMACAQSSHCPTRHETNITPASATSANNLALSNWLIGDLTSPGQVDVTRYDGTIVSSNYDSQAPVEISGVANSNQTLSFNSMTQPNRELIFDWPMSQIQGAYAVDARGNKAAYSDNVRVNFQPNERKSTSYYFTGSSKVKQRAQERFFVSEVGFKIEIRPEAFSGDILQLNQGVTLSLTDTGEAVLTAITTQGRYEVKTSQLTLDTWHDITGRFQDNTLIVSVNDGVKISTSTEGSLVYDTDGISLGEGYQGRMREFILYNPTTAPLIVFADSGSESRTVTFDSQGASRVVLESQGLLHANAVQKIAVISDNKEVGSILLTGSTALRTMVSMSAAMSSDAPSFEQLYNLKEQAVAFGDQNFLTSHFVAATIDKTNTTNIDALSTILAAVTLLPDGEMFNEHLLKLQQFFADSGNNSAILAAADSLGHVVKNALNGDLKAYRKTQLGLLVLAETIDHSIQSKQAIAFGINSKQDFDAWMDFLTLPADGWIGYKPPVPTIDSDCSVPRPMVSVGTGIELPAVPCRLTGSKVATIIDVIVTESSAEIASDPSKLPTFLRVFVDALPNADMLYRRYALNVAHDDGSAIVQNSVTQGPYSPLAPNAQAGVPLVALAAYLARLGLKKATFGALKNMVAFTMGRTNSRLNPILTLAALGYLESRMSDGCVDDCVPIDAELHKGVRNTQILFFVNMLYKGKFTDEAKNAELSCRIWDGTQGKQFEMAMIAYFHAQYEFADKAALQIVDLQRYESIVLLKENNKGVISKHSDYGRHYDIVLRGNDRDNDPKNQIIVELKSSQANRSAASFNKRTFDARFPLWKILERKYINKDNKSKSRSTTVHRQLVLDNVATNDVTISGKKVPQRFAKDYVWLWQDWKSPRRKTRSSLDPGESIWSQTYKNKPVGVYLRDRFSEIAHTAAGKNVVRTTLKLKKGAPEYFNYTLTGTVSDVDLPKFGKFDWAGSLKGQLKEGMMAQLDPDLRSALEELETYGQDVQSAQENLHGALDYFRAQIVNYLDNEDFLMQMEEQRDEIERRLAEFEDEINNYTLDFVVPDTLVNNCL